MNKANELLRKVYQVNIDMAEQEKEIALKYNDKEMLARVEKGLAEWKAKLAEIKD